MLLKRLVADMEAGYSGDHNPANLSVALNLLRRAWDKVERETIVGCFRDANFYTNNVVRIWGGSLGYKILTCIVRSMLRYSKFRTKIKSELCEKSC